MSRITTLLVMSVLVLTACALSAPTTPAPSAAPPTVAPLDPSPSPSDPIAPTPGPTASPTSPAPAVFTPEELALRDGILRGAIDCEPVRADLPPGAVAGIECDSDEPSVARIGYYRFADDEAMIDAYVARFRSEGIVLDSGGCYDGEGEGAYVPWGDDGLAPYRAGCFVNDAGFANYRATLPGSHVYIGILGRSADMRALEDFAWRGNQDTPGYPTLWNDQIHDTGDGAI